MRVIYEPKGAAREYAELALNLFSGCPHGCTYCYAPGCMRRTREAFHASVTVRTGILDKLRKDVAELAAAHDPREILLCFTSDPLPYMPAQSLRRPGNHNSPDPTVQSPRHARRLPGRLGGVITPSKTAMRPAEQELHSITRQALEIIAGAELRATVLTKNPAGAWAMSDLFKRYRDRLRVGVTLTGWSEAYCRKYEPGAPPAHRRMAYVNLLSNAGVQLWISLEPVIWPAEALRVIEVARPFVKDWKIGKINHNRALEAGVDWGGFVRDAQALLPAALGHHVYWKKSLQEFM
jgi:DNA repair photolyase